MSNFLWKNYVEEKSNKRFPSSSMYEIGQQIEVGINILSLSFQGRTLAPFFWRFKQMQKT